MESKVRKSKYVLEDVLKLDATQRFEFALATTAQFLDGIGFKYAGARVMCEDDARFYAKLALRRALAIIDGDDAEARAIQKEGDARQPEAQARILAALESRQHRDTNTLH